MTHFRHLLSFLFATVIAISAGHVHARDTDIYFLDASGASSLVKPNILLSIDTSGSMNINVSGTTQSRVDVMKDAVLTVLDSLANNPRVGLMRFTNGGGGPIMYPAKNLDDTVTNTGNVQVVTQDAADDARENSTGTVTTTETTIALNYSVDERLVGVRFRRLYIPQGATITSARIQFKASNSDSSNLNLDISADLSPNAPVYQATANNISGRTQTAAKVNWNSVPSWTSESFYDTPDLTAVLQEVVNQSGWCYGNAAAFTFKRQGGLSGTRYFYAYDTYQNNPNNIFSSPVTALIVTYNPSTVPSSSSCSQIVAQVSASSDDAEERTNGNMVLTGNVSTTQPTARLEMMGPSGTYANTAIGVRFKNINIPQGATITSARLEFEVDTTSTTATNLTIKGHKVSSSTTFTSSDNNISSRLSTEATTASVTWNSVPNLAVNYKLVSPDLTSVVQEIVNQAGWANGNAMTFLISGSGNKIVESYDSEPAAAPKLYITYVSSGTWQKTVRDQLRELVVAMRADANTPIVDNLYEAALYYRGSAVDSGTRRYYGASGGEESRWTRVSHPDSYTGGTLNTPAGCTAAYPDGASCIDEQITGSARYISPIQYSCQSNHIVLLTDGEPTANSSITKIKTLTGLSSCSPNSGNEACGRELAYFLANSDQNATLADRQTVNLHTIGLTLASTFLSDLASKGGGLYRSANTAGEVVTAFTEILNSVITSPTSFVSPSLSVNAFNRLYNRDEVYFTLFSPQLTYAWAGNTKKYTLCATGSCNFGEVIDADSVAAIDPTTSKIKTAARSYWSASADGPAVQSGGAGSQIPSYGSRRVYTYTGSSDVPASAVDLTVAAHAVADSNANITQAMLNATSAAERTSLINWMRGQDTEDENSDGSTADNRWGHADALHSRPITITYGGTASSPVIKLVVGTNEGALRMIDAATGQEDWIVYPPEFLAMQKDLRTNANGIHKIGLDGSPTVQVIDANNDGVIDPGAGDKVRVFIGMRRGGRDIYAFDLTPDSILTTSSAVGSIKPKFLWRIKGGTGNFTLLGQTWSRPQLAKVWIKCPTGDTSCDDGVGSTQDSKLKDVLIFAGGYDTNYDGNDSYTIPSGADSYGNAIYMVDPVNGSRLWWASGSSSGADLVLSNMQYSIPSDLALLDSNGDSAVDRIYVGDTRGQLFRIDLGKQLDPGASSASLRNGGSSSYVFANISSTATNQNRRAFFYPPDVAQIRDATFSSTEVYDYVTIATGDREDPLDKKTSSLSEEAVHNRIYAFRDVDTREGAPSTTPSAITEASMYDATSNVLANTSDTNYATALSSIQASKGWYIDLKTSASPYWIGEKSLARTTIFGGVLYVTTYTPPQSGASTVACGTPAEGTATQFALDLLNGAGRLTGGARSEVIGGGIPSELVVVIRPGGTSALIGTSGGAKQTNVGSTLPRFKTYWKQE